MRKNILCLSLSCLIGLELAAQIIDNRLGNAFKEEMYFNQEFLWQNKIRSVTGTQSIKRPNRPIDMRPDIVVYRFNDVGLLEQIDKVTSVMSLVDSLTIQFKRNDLGEVELRTETGKKGFHSKKFIYDTNGKLSRLDHATSENISEENMKLESGNSMIINSETFAYAEAGPTAERKSNYNNYGLLYSNQVITRNDLGYVLSDTEELVMSNKTTTHGYQYNEKGWVSEISATNNAENTVKKEKFYYDEIGNLLKVEYYTDSRMEREVEVLYTETMLVEALLDHDIQSHDIIITKFKYEIN